MSKIINNNEYINNIKNRYNLIETIRNTQTPGEVKEVLASGKNFSFKNNNLPYSEYINIHNETPEVEHTIICPYGMLNFNIIVNIITIQKIK